MRLASGLCCLRRSGFAAELRSRGVDIERLDGDMLRGVFPTGFTRQERDDHIRRVGFIGSNGNRPG